MGQIQSPESAVPPRAVALPPVQLPLGLNERIAARRSRIEGCGWSVVDLRFSILNPRSSIFRFLEAAAAFHHPAVHFLGFGILDFEVAPIAASQEPLDLGQAVVVL